MVTREQIRAIRGQMELTQELFSFHLGVERNTVARWEMGAHSPTGKRKRTLVAMAKRMGIAEDGHGIADKRGQVVGTPGGDAGDGVLET